MLVWHPQTTKLPLLNHNFFTSLVNHQIFILSQEKCWINIHTLRAPQGSVSCLGILGHADWSIQGLEHLFSFLCVRFPLSKPQLASKWVHSLGMKNFIPTANTCLCSEHFRPDCFRDYNGKQFLREDAVPTIFTQGQDSSKVRSHNRIMLILNRWLCFLCLRW